MDIKTNYYTTQKIARYSTYGKLGPNTKYFWFALHGSKMLCEQMLYKFKAFDPNEHFVVAPEALIRFYEKDFGGPVVASWMTKRDRLNEIEDFSEYLSGLYRSFVAQLPQDCIKSMLAFSQGGTTAFRWLHAREVEVDHLIPYACWIPEDILLSESKTDLAKINLLFTYGIEDQFLTEKRIAMINAVIAQNNLTVKSLPYKGDHRVSKEQLQNIFEHYIKK